MRERLGCSFGAHVAELRVARAQLLLAESDLPVIEVAAEAGFGSLGHFNQRFGATGQHRRFARWRAVSAPRSRAVARSSRFTQLRFTTEHQAEKGVLPS